MIYKKEKQRLFWRIFAQSLFLVIVFCCHSTPGLSLRVFGVLPLLLIPFVVCVGMFEHETSGAFFGLAAGILWDVVSPRLPGFNAILLMVIGCACGLCVSYLMKNSLISSVYLCFASLLAYQLLDWLCNYCFFGRPGAGYAFWHFYVPQMLYSLVYILPYYFIMRFLVKTVRR